LHYRFFKFYFRFVRVSLFEIAKKDAAKEVAASQEDLFFCSSHKRKIGQMILFNCHRFLHLLCGQEAAFLQEVSVQSR
jgi:hypothetical protein